MYIRYFAEIASMDPRDPNREVFHQLFFEEILSALNQLLRVISIGNKDNVLLLPLSENQPKKVGDREKT